LLLAALAQEDLEARLAEALPWLLQRFWDVDTEWLIKEARLRNLQNRLGFVVSLALRAGQTQRPSNEERDRVLGQLREALEQSKLAKENTFCRVLHEAERLWLRDNRSEEAKRWNLLTDLEPEVLHQ
jgi:hypothetical protein